MPLVRPFAAALCLASVTAAAADPKPLLKGTYEVTRMNHPDGTVQDLPKAFLSGDVVWMRMAMAFDDTHVLVEAAALFRDGGHYRSCEVAVMTDVTWTATGFTVPTGAVAQAEANDFGALDAKDAVDSKNCKANIDAGTLTVTAGKQITIGRDGGTNVLVPTAELIGKIDWRKHKPAH